jgi:hypothetical protein
MMEQEQSSDDKVDLMIEPYFGNQETFPFSHDLQMVDGQLHERSSEGNHGPFFNPLDIVE